MADYARQLGMEALLKLNQRALELHQASEGKPDADRRMTFGTYFYSSRQAEEDDERGKGE